MSEWTTLFRGLSAMSAGVLGRTCHIKKIKGNIVGCTDLSGTIMLNPDNDLFDGATEEQRKALVTGVFSHELMHQVFTDFDLRGKATDELASRYQQKVYLTLDNVLEDPAIEWMAPTVIGGPLLKCLRQVIAWTYEKSSGLEESDTAYSQYVNALIMFGDMGPIKGNFTFKEAEDCFQESISFFYDGIHEPDPVKRAGYSKRLFEVSRPLWEKDEEEEKQLIQSFMEALESLKDTSGSGRGTIPSPESLESAEDSKKDRRRKHVIISVSRKPGTETSEKPDGTDGPDGPEGSDKETVSGDLEDSMAHATGEDEEEDVSEDASGDTVDTAGSTDESDEIKDSGDGDGPSMDTDPGTEDGPEGSSLDEEVPDGPSSENADPDMPDSTPEGDAKDSSEPEGYPTDDPEDPDDLDDLDDLEDDGYIMDEDEKSKKGEKSEKEDTGTGSTGDDKGSDGPDGTDGTDGTDGPDGPDGPEGSDKGTVSGDLEDSMAHATGEDEEEDVSEDASGDTVDTAGSTDESDEIKDSGDGDGPSMDTDPGTEDGPEGSSLDEEVPDGPSSENADPDMPDSTPEGDAKDSSEPEGYPTDDPEDPDDLDDLDDLEDDGYIMDEEELRKAIESIESYCPPEEPKDEDLDLTDVEVKMAPEFGKVSCYNSKVQSKPEDAEAYGQILSACHTAIHSMKRDFEKIFRGDIREEVEYKHSGKASIKRMYGSRITSRVFEKRTERSDRRDMCIGIMVDESGSMGGGRYVSARNACVILSESIAKLKIPLYIMGYSGEYMCDADHYHYITWNNTREARMRLLQIHGRRENFDGYSIRYMAGLMKKRPEAHKLLFIITDGLPECGNYRTIKDGIADTSAAIKAARKDMDVIGLEIGDHFVEKMKQMYGTGFIHVPNETELPGRMSKCLKKTVCHWD